MRGKTYEEIYGTEKAAELRQQRKEAAKRNKLGSANKGKTYEEIYGKEKAKELTKLRAEACHLVPNHLKGKTYEEVYGLEKATELRRSRGRKGPANNWWRGGPKLNTGYRGVDWPEARRKARERDNNTCQDCSTIPTRRIDVHHKIPYEVSKDNSLENLISLCSSCHKKADMLYISTYGRYLIEPSTEEIKERLSKAQIRIWATHPTRRQRHIQRMLGNSHSPKNLPRNNKGQFTKEA